ncbi:MAG: Twitching motility protein PilT [uncultured Acidimicrobiales bacterium]|uniref:Twitching motility protein PilT n=1 Tax=uncultured Acidimicrobiales bacterium TaxID=310071 RepID=A0A6J4INL9_9ACTN|nr:MAG: Twitching motility protein PilT [uncultured Acidimicrobiales bacterium]
MAHELLDALLHHLADQQGSDLHIKVGSPPRIRVNGALTRLDEPSLTPDQTAEMASAIMRNDVAQQFEERNDVDFAYSVPNLGRFRVNAFRQRGTVGMIFRRVQTSAASFEELGLPEVVARLSSEHRGLVLVTGPTGSGKTTTLAAMIDYINNHRECHIVTIEDPIEVLHRDKFAAINQREIGFDTNNFAAAMRAAMRQDPDVILVGEMRDQETVSAALSAAETGHLVFSTLHTIDATETVNRIVDFFPPHQQHQIRVALAGALKGTICQRLVPTADGKGRVAALEVMIVNGRIQNCIVDSTKGGEMHAIIADGEYYGMQTFDQALVKLYQRGLVDMRGAMTTATSPHDLKVMLQQAGLVSATTGR